MKIKTPEKMIEVKCPKCEKTYEKYIYWTGRGIPKYLCDICKDYSDTINIDMDM